MVTGDEQTLVMQILGSIQRQSVMDLALAMQGWLMVGSAVAMHGWLMVGLAVAMQRWLMVGLTVRVVIREWFIVVLQSWSNVGPTVLNMGKIRLPNDGPMNNMTLVQR